MVTILGLPGHLQGCTHDSDTPAFSRSSYFGAEIAHICSSFGDLGILNSLDLFMAVDTGLPRKAPDNW